MGFLRECLNDVRRRNGDRDGLCLASPVCRLVPGERNSSPDHRLLKQQGGVSDPRGDRRLAAVLDRYIDRPAA